MCLVQHEFNADNSSLVHVDTTLAEKMPPYMHPEVYAQAARNKRLDGRHYEAPEACSECLAWQAKQREKISSRPSKKIRIVLIAVS